MERDVSFSGAFRVIGSGSIASACRLARRVIAIAIMGGVIVGGVIVVGVDGRGDGVFVVFGL